MPNSNSAGYGTGSQAYPGGPEHNGSDSGYMSGGNYGYPSATAATSYHTSAPGGGGSSDGTSAMSAHHAHAAVSSQSDPQQQQQQQHYYGDVHHQRDAYQATSMHSDYHHRPNNKCHPSAYYEQQPQPQTQQQQQATAGQLHVHQGGEASSIPSSYVSSPDPFPAAPGIATTATAIAAATAAVITPPTVHNDAAAVAVAAAVHHDSYGTFGNYYGADPSVQGGTNAAVQPQPQADNSNSSSDFNFLSNLANDFAPEYYQLS